MRAALSHYWPPLCGPNCYKCVAGVCISPTSSGKPWQQGIGIWCACPPQFDFGTVFVLPGGEAFECWDRGGDIITRPDGVIWLDLLVKDPPVPFGTVVTVEVRRPG